jgi:hypothetical protein
VGTVTAAGNSNDRRKYTFTDNIASLIQKDVVYYRIRQVDVDTRSRLSNIGVVRLSKAIGISTWPNPFGSTITVNVNSAAETVLYVNLTDVTGRSLRSMNKTVSRGVNQVVINELDNLANGIYFLEITDRISGNKTVEKLMKNR